MRNTEEGEMPYFNELVYLRGLVNFKALHKYEEYGYMGYIFYKPHFQVA